LYIKYCPLLTPGEGIYYGEVWSERLLSEKKMKYSIGRIFEAKDENVNCNIVSEWGTREEFRSLLARNA
jgi:hypothetical protein